METGLFFLLGTMSLVAGILSARFNKPVARALFLTALVSFLVGIVVFMKEAKTIRSIVAEFENDKHIVCVKDDVIYRISKDEGWKLVGNENFVKGETNLIIWAKFCKVDEKQ